MSNNLIDEAEFLLHLAEENSITRLRNLLQEATAERALPILRRINQFYNGNCLWRFYSDSRTGWPH
jgi:hypothetical protein